jgi:hypothetical protein
MLGGFLDFPEVQDPRMTWLPSGKKNIYHILILSKFYTKSYLQQNTFSVIKVKKIRTSSINKVRTYAIVQQSKGISICWIATVLFRPKLQLTLDQSSDVRLLDGIQKYGRD